MKSVQVKINKVLVELDVDTTEKRVIIYNTDGSIYGQAGVQNKHDFNYDKLLSIALKRSGATINE